MKSIIATLKGGTTMQATLKSNHAPHPFWIIVQKEVSDLVRSWRFIILLALMALTCLGSLYSAVQTLRSVDPTSEELRSFVFLRLFTLSDGTIPSFMTFVGFLGPLLGLGLGFDAINSERNKGTLSRMLSSPIHRDYILSAKFVAALIVIGFMFLSLGFMVMGIGLLTIGIPPVPEEFLRMLFFLLLSIVYVAFWLNLSILFSVRLRQPATAALSSIAIWIFFSVFYGLITSLVGNSLNPGESATAEEQIGYQETMLFIERLSPNYLFEEATTTLLMPTVRSLGPLTMEQMYGAIPNTPLPLGQSLLLAWPQLTCLVAATVICFGISYRLFMRQEIRSR
jgi:ABC-2 type transport system permease protein